MKKPISSSFAVLMGPVVSVTALKIARTGEKCFRFQIATHQATANGNTRSCFHTVCVWGDYAEVAARIIEPKRRVQVIGELVSYQYGRGPRYVEVKVNRIPIQLLMRDIDAGPEDAAPEISWNEYAEDEPLIPTETDEGAGGEE